MDTKREERIQEKHLKPDPEHVSSDSTVIPALGTQGQPEQQEADPDMMGGIRSDLVGLAHEIRICGVCM